MTTESTYIVGHKQHEHRTADLGCIHLLLHARQALKQLSPIAPAKDLERVFQHDGVHEVQGLPQDQPCHGLAQLIIQLDADICRQTAVIHCSPHSGGLPGCRLVRRGLTVGQKLLGPAFLAQSCLKSLLLTAC